MLSGKIGPGTMLKKKRGKDGRSGRERSLQEGGKGIKDLGCRRPLYLRKERTIGNGIRERLVRNSKDSSIVENSAVNFRYQATIRNQTWKTIFYALQL
jgi:hypothetical protein